MESSNGVRLHVGGHKGLIQGEREDLVGPRMFSSTYGPFPSNFKCRDLEGIIDSGAFSDSLEERLTFEEALLRQLRWESKASALWREPWRAHALVSYDLLIDEVWCQGIRTKERWSVQKAEEAVEVTVDAAKYLAANREVLAPRKLILSCQGVDAFQYAECVQEVLKVALPADIIGLGGWCILGCRPSWLPEFFATIRLILPLIAARGITHIHIFGVLYLPALGRLLWLADQYGLSVSTDSTRPILQAVCKQKEDDWTRGDASRLYWRNNVRWWKNLLGNLRHSSFYSEPPGYAPRRQLCLFGERRAIS